MPCRPPPPRLIANGKRFPRVGKIWTRSENIATHRELKVILRFWASLGAKSSCQGIWEQGSILIDSIGSHVDSDADNPDASFFHTPDKWVIRIVLLKSPDIGLAQLGVIFTGSDFSRIHTTDFDLVRNPMPYRNKKSDVQLDEKWVVWIIQSSFLIKIILIWVIPRFGLFKNAIIRMIRLCSVRKNDGSELFKSASDATYSRERQLQIGGSYTYLTALISCVSRCKIISYTLWFENV